jgi:hypothetical protein
MGAGMNVNVRFAPFPMTGERRKINISISQGVVGTEFRQRSKLELLAIIFR